MSLIICFYNQCGQQGEYLKYQRNKLTSVSSVVFRIARWFTTNQGY